MPMSPRLLRPRATGFDPKSISGLVGWWDASDSSTVTLNAGRVSALANKVAGGPAQVQATAINQPLMVQGGRNGRDIIRYDDTGRFLNHATSQGIGFYAIAMAPTGVTNFGGLFSFSDRYGILRQGTTDNAYFDATSMFTSASYRRNGVSTGVYGTDWAVFTQGGTVLSKAAVLVADVGGRRTTGDIGEFLVYSSDLTLTQKQAIERYLGKKWGITVA
jgi:hypothetical protein